MAFLHPRSLDPGEIIRCTTGKSNGRLQGVIICGHTRLLAVQKLGLEQAPVHVADHLTPAQVRAYRLLDNRSQEKTEWDFDLLGLEMVELKDLDMDLTLTGFDAREIDVLPATDAELEGRTNQVLELPSEAITRPGDLWNCGAHRSVPVRWRTSPKTESGGRRTTRPTASLPFTYKRSSAAGRPQ